MSRSVHRFGFFVSLGVCAVSVVLAASSPLAQAFRGTTGAGPIAPATAQSAASADAATHKQWMNDASDAQENFRFALTDRDQKAAQEALVTLESLMGKTEEYWTARKFSDGVKVAKETHAFATQAVSQFKTGNLPAAQDSFDKMGASCNACHELKLEKR